MDTLKSLINTNKSGSEVDARHKRCEEMREESMTKCPRVTFLVSIMEKMGCKMEPGFFSSVECEGQINGGFHLDEDNKPGVVLCQNHIQDQEWMDRTLAHELIHAYDHCRAKVDWNNCEHHACSEIRAAALSGDCNWKYEFFRKNFNIDKQHQICTRRRAKLSIMHNPACKGKTSGMQMEVTQVVSAEPPQHKKRKVERRMKLRKTALCKHFDKPGGCPFSDCKFAHGRSEVADGGNLTVAAQRKLIREQVIARAEGQFQPTGDVNDPTAPRRGTMIERYYTEMYSCDMMGQPLEDQYVHMHSNRLCVVGVAASHPLMKQEIVAIEFSPNVLESKVSGKKKKGGQFLLPDTILCLVHCKNGQSYTLRSCIRGTLLEVNERLLDQPTLLQNKHLSDGYLVIVQPKKTEAVEIQESLLTKDEYKQYRSITVMEQPAASSDDPVQSSNAPEAVPKDSSATASNNIGKIEE